MTTNKMTGIALICVVFVWLLKHKLSFLALVFVT